ncbi:hypothetical protein L0P02_13085, partial [Bifidobacterium longum]|nr:hypothetical protein [Bifidobacterium longum]
MTRLLDCWGPEFHQLFAGRHVLTFDDIVDEASPAHLNGINTDVNQDWNAIVGFQTNCVPGGWEVSNNGPGEWC